MFVKPAIPDRPPGDSPVFCRCSGLRLLPIYTLFWFLFTAVGCQTEPSTSDAPSAGMETPVEIVEIRGTDTSKMVSKVPTIEETGVGGLEQPSPSSSRPTDEEVQRPSRSPLVSFLTDQDELEVPEFTDAELHKNFTLILLAAQPDLIALKILKPICQALSDSEKSDAIKLILAQDYKFLKLQRRRSEVLEHAQNENDIEGELRRIDAETVATSRMLQSKVLKTVRKKPNQ